MLPSIREAQAYGRTCLIHSSSPDVDVQYLLCHLLNCSPTRLLLDAETDLTEQQWQDFKQFIERRQTGEPIAHITGSRGFWSLDLAVNDSTLIPRPDTELLVALALAKVEAGMQIIDLGTGSGAIALSIAAERPDITMIATDFHLPAVQLAQANARKHKLNNVHFIQASWLTACQENQFDMVISNPPYIEADDPHLQQGDVRFEPLSALISGPDGLDDIRLITKQAADCLRPNGWLLVEHGYDQSQAVQHLFSEAGFSHISAHQDFGGNDRAVMGQLTL
ncbi:peptide chain release factor N(5)-glutamine methyltransferase [Methylophaga sulfidovorans]|uniref:Release factor glutamine methyltransferase n=1 Tax=Methylophaga sulfidovorans TaxID=45496 RepID=A0A1I3WXV6_9GAMM|nr:peptide chain release factor N(5)-glutamine methyltransferase [Methylophaga sulfidovorans]SFK12233.1 [protein release factor]-glutamine N5-methyltransferase [Methylophaga sulfidovorans]